MAYSACFSSFSDFTPWHPVFANLFPVSSPANSIFDSYLNLRHSPIELLPLFFRLVTSLHEETESDGAHFLSSHVCDELFDFFDNMKRDFYYVEDSILQAFYYPKRPLLPLVPVSR